MARIQQEGQRHDLEDIHLAEQRQLHRKIRVFRHRAAAKTDSQAGGLVIGIDMGW